MQRTLDHVTSSDKGYIYNTTPTIKVQGTSRAEGLRVSGSDWNYAMILQ